MAEKLTAIDKICVEYRKQGKCYADWQKEKYPTVASHKDGRLTYGKDNRN